MPDHAVKLGRQTMHLRELTYAQLQEIASNDIRSGLVRPDLDLLITVGRFWGAGGVKRIRFVAAPERHEPSRMETCCNGFGADDRAKSLETVAALTFPPAASPVHIPSRKTIE